MHTYPHPHYAKTDFPADLTALPKEENPNLILVLL